MIFVASLAFLLAAANAPTLEQVRADQNAEHRAHLAIDYAAAAEKAAETANDKGDQTEVASQLHNMVAAIELARDSFAAAGKTPVRQPGSFKNAELRTHEILVRLGDFRHKVDEEQRAPIESSIMKIQEIHDVWFEGIMGKKK